MSRRWLVPVGLALLVVGLGWWVLRVTLLADSDRTNASGYGQFVLAAVGLVIAALPLVRDWTSRADTDPALDAVTDDLALAVRTQWTAAALDRGLLHPSPLLIRWHRSVRPVASPVTAATAPRAGAFEPLPGLDRTTSAGLRDGTHRTLHQVYGGLASGRLIIAGEPGSGKSSAAILLLLDVLDHRDHQPADARVRVPVPVLFTLSGWDPAGTTVHDWLAGKLTELAPLSGGRRGRRQASALLAAGRIAVFLDGLDEVALELRPTILRALAEQATFRLVLLTRTDELTAAAEHQLLTGAACVELCPLTPADAADYLRDSLPDPPPPHWHGLLDALTSGDATPITEALTNPLAVSLLRDTYHPPQPPDSLVGTPAGLLDTDRFRTPVDITDHLLDHAITSAYTPRPGQPPPRYTPETARHTLTVVAERLRDHRTRDLRWWQIREWVPASRRVLSHVASTGVVLALLAWTYSGIVVSLAFGPVIAVAMGLSTSSRPIQLARFDRRRIQWWDNVWISLLCGLVGGLLFGVVRGEGELFLWLAFGLASGIVITFLLSLLDAIVGFDARRVQTPLAQRRDDLFVWLAVGLVIGLGSGVGGWLAQRPIVVGGPVVWLLIGLVSGPVWGGVLSEAWSVVIGQFLFARRFGTPVRLLRFLDDAHSRHLLRTVGTVYQFRHATLQDRLAPPLPDTADPPA